MAGKILRVALVGASTLLGKEVLEELVQSAPPSWNVMLLEEGDEVEGHLTAAGDEPFVTHTLNKEAVTGMDLVLFAGEAAVTRQYLPLAVQAGAAVVDLSGTSEGREGFLLRSPWVEAGQRPDLTTAGLIGPHPVSLMLALIAGRLGSTFGRVEMIATALEPASQAGAAGVDELHQQTVGLLSFQEVPKHVFDTQVAFNLQETLGEEAQVSLQTTRGRVEREMAALLGATAEHAISLHLLQAPVFHGSLISLHLKTATAASVDALRSALHGGVIVAEEETLPSNQAATATGDLLVSVECRGAQANAFWLTLAADNLRLVARSAVMAAAELAALRPGARVQ